MKEADAPWTRRLAVGAIVALAALLMLPNLIWMCVGSSPNMLVDALIVPASLLLALFALSGGRPWIACLLLAPFAMLAPLEAFYIGTYHRPTFAEVIATLIATNPREIHEYLGMLIVPMLACFLVAMLLPFLAAWWSRRAGLRLSNASRIIMAILAIGLPLTTAVVAAAKASGSATARMQTGSAKIEALPDTVQFGYPFGMIPRIVNYRREWTNLRADVDRLDAFRFHARRVTEIPHRQVYVLVIGEASRRDHWQLFGYHRATNPELAKQSNLMPVTDFDSSWPESITAIPMILTRKPVGVTTFTWDEASILRAMHEAGFETWWISNQQAIGKFDSPVSTYAYEADHQEFLNHASWSAPGSYDEDLLQPLHDALDDSDKDLFIVLHMMGSHQSYDYRYPESFKRFRPTETDPVDRVSHEDHVYNSYDNTVLYSDHVLAAIIGILHGSGVVSALWFESDHGETLPNAACSVEGHGFSSRYDYEIPALFWYSDGYATAFPERVAGLRRNAHKRATSADTFESLIGMAGLDFPGHDPSRSLFSPTWRFRTRFVNGNRRVDFDHAKFEGGCEVIRSLHAS